MSNTRKYPGQMASERGRIVHLIRNLDGDLDIEDCLAVTTADPLPQPKDGQVLARARHVGINVGYVDRMRRVPLSGNAPLPEGAVPVSDLVIEIMESRSDRFTVGSLEVVSWAPWAEYQVLDASTLRPVDVSDGVPAVAYLRGWDTSDSPPGPA
jgi:NADPH-dependent curcumin reductase CurA